MYVIVNCVLCGFSWCLEKRVYVYVKFDICKGCCDYFCVLVVFVLFYFYYQQMWLMFFFFGKIFDRFLDFSKIFIVFISCVIDVCEGFYFGVVVVEFIFYCYVDFFDRGLCVGGFDCGF